MSTLPEDHPAVQAQRRKDLRYSVNRLGNPAAPVVERQPVPITEGAARLMEAYRLGEFRLEGGSPTVEAMSCQSFDESEVSLREHDFDSYAAGYQSAMYEQAKTLLHLCAAPPELVELQATIAQLQARVAELESGRGEPVVTILQPDPYDDRGGAWMSSQDLRKLEALPVGTKLYIGED